MNQFQQVNEKTYPIRAIWLLKSMFRVTWLYVIFFVYISIQFNSRINYFFYIFLALVLMQSVYLVFYRVMFHYLLEEKFLTIQQGIISKQQKHTPYGVIQNIFVRQDIFDRLFNLASLTIENAAQAGGINNLRASKSNKYEKIGFRGNRIVIPGLKREDAESLKIAILEKMKANPIDDSQSGL